MLRRKSGFTPSMKTCWCCSMVCSRSWPFQPQQQRWRPAQPHCPAIAFGTSETGSDSWWLRSRCCRGHELTLGQCLCVASHILLMTLDELHVDLRQCQGSQFRLARTFIPQNSQDCEFEVVADTNSPFPGVQVRSIGTSLKAWPCCQVWMTALGTGSLCEIVCLCPGPSISDEKSSDRRARSAKSNLSCWLPGYTNKPLWAEKGNTRTQEFRHSVLSISKKLIVKACGRQPQRGSSNCKPAFWIL